ncbi:protein of unknown function [Hyphomicrobium sp. MC1]|nr:protein of unknown function [Hyphomicrobium sp. MC1]
MHSPNHELLWSRIPCWSPHCGPKRPPHVLETDSFKVAGAVGATSATRFVKYEGIRGQPEGNDVFFAEFRSSAAAICAPLKRTE